MSLTLAALELARLLADPAGAETPSAATGCRLVVVEVADACAGDILAGADLLTVPSVVVVVARDPGCCRRQ